MDLINVYSLLNDNSTIKKIQLSQELQNKLKDYISPSVEKFKSLTEIKFNGEYKPDDDEILCIYEFENPHEKLDPTSIEILDENDLKNIKSLLFVFTKNENIINIAYQCFDSRKIIRPEKWFLIYSQDTYSKIENKGLIIDSKIDVLYVVEEKKLLFTSYHNASKILDLSNFFREATDNEIEKFTTDNIFRKQNDFSKDLFDSRMRKKLFLIMKNNVLENVKKNFEDALEHAKKFNIDSYFDKEIKQISLPGNKKELKKLLDLLNDDLFSSPITGNNYEANSKKRILLF